MKLILVHPPSATDAGMFDAPDDDPGHAPWIALRNALRERGAEIQTTLRRPDHLAQADWIFFMNVPQELARPAGIRRWLAELCRARAGDGVWQQVVASRARGRLALFLWEPHVVLPANYVGHVHERFARVFTWSKDLAERGGRYRPIVWPQPSGWTAEPGLSFADRKLLVNFSGNKSSGHPLELYSARVEVIRWMERHMPEAFDHYGPGWSTDYPSWRGTVASKFDVYPRYRFGLCFENMHSVRGYVTEKIFDCLRAGVVPVYWGAPDVAEAVDAAAFVDRRNFGSTQELIGHLEAMQPSTWHGMRDAGTAYLAGERFARFLPRAFATQVIEGLET